jgi:hypothetical protein
MSSLSKRAPSSRHFKGAESPRQLRVIMALLTRSRSRKAIDEIAGCSNGPDLVARLRKNGLAIPCENTQCIDRDGKEVAHGVYYFTSDDKRKVRNWLIRRERAMKGETP